MFQLNTPRLILRDFIEADWHAMHPIFSDVETTQYIAWIKSETEIDTRDRIKDIIYHNQLQPRTVYNLVIVRQADQEVLGWIGIGEASDPTIGDLNFGYALRKTDWGQGHMTEALRALLDFCFVELGVKKIFGECDVANTGSARVMEKAGMSLEARLTEQDKDTARLMKVYDTVSYITLGLTSKPKRTKRRITR